MKPEGKKRLKQERLFSALGLIYMTMCQVKTENLVVFWLSGYTSKAFTVPDSITWKQVPENKDLTISSLHVDWKTQHFENGRVRKHVMREGKYL